MNKFKYAGELEPPPLIVQKIYKWLALETLKRIQVEITPKILFYRGFFETTKMDRAKFDAFIEGFKFSVDSLWDKLVVNSPATYEFKVFNGTKIEFGYQIKEGMYVLHTKVDKRNTFYKEFNTKKDLKKSVDVLAAINKKKYIVLSKHLEDQIVIFNSLFTSLQRITGLGIKDTENLKLPKKIAEKIEIELDNWKYLGLAVRDTSLLAKKVLLYPLEVSLEWGNMGIQEAAEAAFRGTTHRQFLDLSINFNSPLISEFLTKPSLIKRFLEECKFTIMHELQHFSQHIIELLGVEGFGVGSKAKKNKRVEKPIERHERYILEDDEYLPWITTTTGELIEFLNKIPKQKRRYFLGLFLKVEPMPAEVSNYTNKMMQGWVNAPLEIWKAKDPYKYKNAIKEIFKRISAEIEI